MIGPEYFLGKLKEYSNLTGNSIKKELVDALYGRLKNTNESDFNHTIEEMAFSGERLTLPNLQKAITHSRAIRTEKESATNQRQEAQAAKRFWHDEAATDGCKRDQCRGCQKIDYCGVRGKEWLRGIDRILDVDKAFGFSKWKPRPKGEGKKMAEEIIHYMQAEFMGGIQ